MGNWLIIQIASQDWMKFFLNTTSITILILSFSSCESDQKPEDSTLCFISSSNEISVWNGTTQEIETVHDFPNDFKLHSINFSNKDLITVSQSSENKEIAIHRNSGDTVKCPCPDRYFMWTHTGNGDIPSDYRKVQYYVDTIYAISILEHSHWKEKIVRYELRNLRENKNTGTYDINVSTRSLNENSNLQYDSTTYVTCGSRINDRIYPCYNGIDSDSWYSTSETINGVRYFTRSGDIYKTENGKEELFLKYEHGFSRKTGGGYHMPSLNFDGSKLVLIYAESSFYSLFDPNATDLIIVDTETKEIKTLSNDDYINPQFSPDGRFIVAELFESYVSSNEIHIYNVEEESFTTIGKGSSYAWLGKKNRKNWSYLEH